MIGGEKCRFTDEIFLQFGSCKMFYRFLMMIITVVDILIETPTPLIETFHMCELLCRIVRTYMCGSAMNRRGKSQKYYR